MYQVPNHETNYYYPTNLISIRPANRPLDYIRQSIESSRTDFGDFEMSEAAEMFFQQRLKSPTELDLSNRISMIEGKLAELQYTMRQLLSQYSTVDTLVSVKMDEEKEYIDIDYQNLEQNKFYLVQYQGEIYAVKKISQHELAFYDVVK
jgi:hypothetical protein